ncbi:hypothetical protein DES40_1749 [Litorimonas taeanensis]|uniref:Helix-turn-helix protein n=1 Tax=Litorimonas taeanensis TaxID=568099 RepID=A0A420WDB0_9PROT|nr:hypothetical protein [Litorimonas taeanensis]RKQ68973.1 hypothetical protein DES40_1749 [Litorimonas taeanensis]
MTIRETILNQAQDYCKAHDVSARAFCLGAGVDKRVLFKLERGENVSLGTLELIEAYLKRLGHEGKLASDNDPVMGKARVNIPMPLDGALTGPLAASIPESGGEA